MSRLRAAISGARRYPNVTLALAVAVICFLVGFATGFWLLFRLAYLLAIVVPLVYFWTRSMIEDLEVDVVRRTQRVSQGQSLDGRIVLRNTARLPKVWLEVEDRASIPGHGTRRVMTLRGRGVEVWRYETPALRRGLYELGPVTVTATDPFGFFRFSRVFGHPTPVLVYPNAPELPNFYIPPANLPGDGRFRRRTHNVTPNVAGLRPYEPGDSYNRIHWPATARTNSLIVKLFELDPASDIWIVLDLQRAVQVGEGSDDGTEETAVKIAASIARYFIAANRTVGLVSFGADLRVDEAERGANHYTRILESLALARATGDVPLSRLLLEESRRFGRHTTLVVVTPSTDDTWALSLMALQSRGVKVAAVLLEGATYGEPAGDITGSALDVYGTLAAGGVYTYTLKQSDDLGRALSFGADASLLTERGVR
jgi:uncharacterized protein (DUF58 family)